MEGSFDTFWVQHLEKAFFDNTPRWLAHHIGGSTSKTIMRRDTRKDEFLRMAALVWATTLGAHAQRQLCVHSRS